MNAASEWSGRLRTKSGKPVGRIGQGTWYLGETPRAAAREQQTLQAGVAAGMNLIDTAEMYASGGAERMLAGAISPLEREALFLVSKVFPHNAGKDNIFKSCDASLSRMGTDYLDLYLLHWRGAVPLRETAACMEELVARGKIRHWGVSNFDLDDMKELWSVPSGDQCVTNQVLYHLGSRGVEFDLLPWMQQRDVPLMAYCPLAQAGALRRGLLSSATVKAAAERHNAAPEQILLAFLLTKPGVLPIPRTGQAEHARANAEAAKLRLSAEALEELDRAFPAPTSRVPLDIQ